MELCIHLQHWARHLRQVERLDAFRSRIVATPFRRYARRLLSSPDILTLELAFLLEHLTVQSACLPCRGAVLSSHVPLHGILLY